MLPNPGFCRELHPQPSSHCRHKSAQSGTFCGEELDSIGRHAGACKTQGLFRVWHDKIRDWVLSFIATQTGCPTTPPGHEPRVPAWDYDFLEHGESKHYQAYLDGGFTDKRGKPGYFDVTITSAFSTCPVTLRARAAKDGAAAHDAVTRKRWKYPPAKNPGVTFCEPVENDLDLWPPAGF